MKVNDAYTKITGYCKDDAINKTSTIFREGPSTYSQFRVPRESLVRYRFWQGEVSDRRKDGEDYAAWLRVTAVIDPCDVVTHYIVSFVDITENKQFQEKIHGLSYLDTLTGLLNRRALRDRLEQILAGSERRQDFGAILLLDLDHFKLLNDARGREHGDRLLQQVAKRIKGNLHADDLMARVDGDSFAIILSGLGTQSQNSASKARQVAELIRVALGDPFDALGCDDRISSSIGICLFSGSGIAPDLLIEHAEAAMYTAKQDGRNCIRFYDPATQAALEQRFNLIAMLHKALPNELRLYYQVQVDNAGIPMGAETLIRWQNPELGLISPAMFIPLAEETGLILPIGSWVLNTACQQLARWASNPAFSHLKLAVNVSAKQFLQPDFANLVFDALSQSGANPSLLKLELTESVMISDADSVIEKMLRLKGHGVSFSLDDFGTGYSSLAYLKRLPLEQLKIDQSFVKNLLQNSNDNAIVRAVITLGQSLGLEVIAEGVETTAQRDALVTFGCDHFQGYLFGRPEPLDTFERLILGGSIATSGRSSMHISYT
jgi:diguanylate cyclase (GGDEF)-like protein/PAS domain S-box-containing protein